MCQISFIAASRILSGRCVLLHALVKSLRISLSFASCGNHELVSFRRVGILHEPHNARHGREVKGQLPGSQRLQCGFHVSLSFNALQKPRVRATSNLRQKRFCYRHRDLLNLNFSSNRNDGISARATFPSACFCVLTQQQLPSVSHTVSGAARQSAPSAVCFERNQRAALHFLQPVLHVRHQRIRGKERA